MVEKAVPPDRPARPNTGLNLFMGGIAGGISGLITGAITVLTLWRKRGSVNATPSSSPALRDESAQTADTARPNAWFDYNSKEFRLRVAPICILICVGIIAWLRWERYEPLNVWLPEMLSGDIGEQYGEAQIRVTSVTQEGQVLLVKFLCDTSYREHEILVRYFGPAFDRPEGLTANLAKKHENLDCLIAPALMDSGDENVVAGSRQLTGASVYQIGFVLPDELAAAKAAVQLRQTHYNKPRGLQPPNTALLLFSLHRRVGKDAAGKEIVELLSGTLSWSRKLERKELTSGDTFGPVVERVVSCNLERQLSGIDFDSGRIETFTFDSAVSDSSKSTNQSTGAEFFTAKGVDAMGFGNPGSPAFNGLSCINGTFALPVEAADWDNEGADTVLSQANNLPSATNPVVDTPEFKKMTVMLWSEDGVLPKTFIFKTGDSGLGILQITGFTENPRCVKLRYKLVQNGGEKNSSHR